MPSGAEDPGIEPPGMYTLSPGHITAFTAVTFLEPPVPPIGAGSFITTEYKHS